MRLALVFYLIIFGQVVFAQTVGSVVQTKKISALSGGMPANTIDAGDHFGCSIDTIGDLNNDGVIDLVVGAFLDDDGGTNRGAVYILFMDTNRTVNSYAKISSTTTSFSSNGIVNGDGFGYRVAGIGDINNDGIPDIGVGSVFSDVGGTDRGGIHIIFLDTNGTVKNSQRINNNSGYSTGGLLLKNNGWFCSVSAIGDIDNDGVPDIAVGASQDPGGSGTSYQKGAIWILRLLSSGKVKSYYKIIKGVNNFTNSIDNGDRLGISVSNIGDINSDNIPDIAVGAFRDGDGGYKSGAVYVILLDTNGSVKSYSKISNNSLTNNPFSGEFGVSVTGVPDMDGNGICDLLVGAYGQDSYTGTAYLINIDSVGSVLGQIKYLGTSVSTNGTEDRFGWGASRWSNSNNNSYIEVCVGAARDDDGGTSAGALYILSIKPFLSMPVSYSIPSCYGVSDGIIVASGSGSNPPFSFIWNDGSTNDTLSNLLSGTYHVTMTNNLGVSISNSITLTQPTIVSVVTSSDTMICSKDSINIFAIANGGRGNKIIHWNNNLGNDNVYKVSPPNTTTYTIFATDTNNCSSDTNEILIIINQLPTVNFSGLYPIYCTNDSPSNLIGSPLGGSFSGSGVYGSIFYPDSAINNLPYEVYYSYTDINGCTNIDTNNTSVFNNPIVEISGIDSIYCSNANDINFGSLPCLGCSYTVNGVSANVFSPSTLGEGNYTIAASYVDFGNGCVGYDTTYSIVYTSDSASFSGLDTIYCEYNNADTLIGIPYGGSFIGAAMVDSVFVPSSANIGINEISYVVGNNYCIDTFKLITTVFETPIVDIGLDTIVPCNSMGITIGENYNSNYFYLWSPIEGLNSPFISNPIANPWVDTTIYILTKTDKISHCVNRDSILVTLAKPLPISIIGDTMVCFNDSIYLMATGGVSYIWEDGNTTNIFSKLITNEEFISVIGIDINNCESEDSIKIGVNPLPTPNLGNDTSIFENGYILLDPGSYISYQWNTGEINPTILVDANNLSLGNYTYAVEVEDQNSCKGSDTIDISIVVGINTIENDINVIVYPNPTKDNVIVKWEKPLVVRLMYIYDIYGNLIKIIETNINTNRMRINLDNYAKGIYNLKLVTNFGVESVKIVLD